MGLSNVDNAIGCRNSRHDAPVTRVAECLRSEVQRGDTAADVQAERSISGEKSRGHYRAATGDHVIALPSLAELIPVSPCSHFGPLRITDTDQLQTFAHARESDVFRRHAQLRVAKQPLALLDRFPSFFDRSEIPSLTRATNYPQPALVPVERKSASNGEVLDYFVRAEVTVAEEAGRIHELFALVHTLSADVRRDDAGLEDVARRYRHDVLIQYREVGVLSRSDGAHHMLLESSVRSPDRHRLERFVARHALLRIPAAVGPAGGIGARYRAVKRDEGIDVFNGKIGAVRNDYTGVEQRAPRVRTTNA